jgi:predicted nucleotide-binding protein (sugar kinase/HSP70/actin superfamily)
MKITIPHLGNVYIAAKILFDGLCIDYVIPPLNNREALFLGSKYSPEEMCLPFKLMIGNYLAGIREGADTVLLVSSCGPCRFGEYSELQVKILKQLGHDMEFIVLDPVKNLGVREFINRLRRAGSSSPKKPSRKLHALQNAYVAMRLMDDIEREVHWRAGFEQNPGECKKLLKQCRETVFQCDQPEKALELLRCFRADVKKLKLSPDKNPLKIAIIGEIYTVIEPFTNLYIEDLLMDLGISVSRRLTPSWWVQDMLLKMIRMNSRELLSASSEYLPLNIGGHARECIGEAVLAARDGMDGAIQIFPMGCMPEIVSKSILPTLSREKNLPVLTLVVDEMTGEAGYMTRIEAFADLLERRRNHVCIGC